MPLAYQAKVFQAAPLTVDVNAAQAQAMLARLAAGMRNPRPVVEGVATAIRQHVKTQFAVGGNPQWVPNKLNTVVAKGHSKALFRGKGRSGIEAATVTTVEEKGQDLAITTRTSAIGRFHQEGRKGPWIIEAKKAPFLSFIVAGERVGGGVVVNLGAGRPAVRAAFRARRSSAQARRARTGRGVIPGRPGAHRVFVFRVTHPGYPARPFMPTIDDAFLQKHWRTPLRAYLFGPSVASGGRR